MYTDALILRDRDTNGDGTLDERLWVQQDANFNVTALVNGSGQVVERYDYDPFGLASVLNADGTAKAGGSGYDWKYLHQGLRYDGGISQFVRRAHRHARHCFCGERPTRRRGRRHGGTGGIDVIGRLCW